jgi:hypothetical protein
MIFKHVRLLVPLGVFLVLPLLGFAMPMPENAGALVFDETCASCHGPTPVHPVLGATLGYDTSGHKNNANSYYANGNGCQLCHTNEGFIEYVNTGKVEGYVAYPSQPNCVTCHTMHETWDFSLRTVKPVKLADGSTFDIGEGNLCANCHQARRGVDSQVEAKEASDVSSHWGAHHGPQADLLNGTNAYEFRGKRYSNSPHRDVIDDGCVSCHMSLPEGRYRFSPELGGHSFNIAGEVHEAGKINLAACADCHEGIGQVRGEEVFDYEANADYDRDGTVEAAQLEVQGLLDALVNKNGTGYLQNTNPPMFERDAEATFHDLGKWAGSRSGSWSEAEIAALWNYKLIVEDRSLGVHNYTYTVQVLYDTLKALDPGLNDSLRPR